MNKKLIIYILDGELMVAAVENRVLLYNALDGTLIKSLRGMFDIQNIQFKY
jgi:hypothetical protein